MKTKTLLTDNATLTDAAIVFYSLENGYGLSESVFTNWLNYLENSVLFDSILADNVVFDTHQWTKRLKDDFKNVDGLHLDEQVRLGIKQKAKVALKSIDNDEAFLIADVHQRNEIRSNLNRTLFYMGLADECDLLYCPSEHRNTLLAHASKFYNRPDHKSELETKLLRNVIDAADNYRANVSNLGVTLCKAEIPPIAAMVIDNAVRCGSWSEAIYDLKRREVVKHFREWSHEVSEKLHNPNTNALAKLTKVNKFIKGWGEGNHDGLTFKVNVGIGSFLNMFKIPVKTEDNTFEFARPFPEKHLVFLNETFKSLITAKLNIDKMRTVKI